MSDDAKFIAFLCCMALMFVGLIWTAFQWATPRSERASQGSVLGVLAAGVVVFLVLMGLFV